MTDAQKRRLTRRIRRIERRLAWNRKIQAAWAHWSEERYRPIRAFINEIVADDPDISDDALVEALIEKVDELLEFQGLAEAISDLGIRLVAALAVAFVRHAPEWLAKRAEQMEARLKELRDQLDRSHTPKGELADTILLDLGFSPEFIAG